MRSKYFTFEHLLYLLALLLALALRLYRLGAAPLADYEAQWALQALGLVKDQAGAVGAQPLYILYTSLLFALLGSTNFLARLLPALAGSLLVLVPLFYYPWLAKTPVLRYAGVILAFGLAIDPGLLALSRLAGGSTLAILFVLLALALILRQKPVWAGVSAALALLSGPAVLQGVLGLLIFWGLARLLRSRLSPEKPLTTIREGDGQPQEFGLSISSLRGGLIALGVTLVLAGTFFLRFPQGLGALVSTLPAYGQGFINPPLLATLGSPALVLLYQPLTLLIYHSLPLLFGLGAVLRAWLPQTFSFEAQHSRLLSLWLVAALVLALLYPARQVGDLAWALLPLWALAALELSHHLGQAEQRMSKWVAAGLAALLLLMAAILQFNLSGLSRFEISPLLFWAMLGGVLLFAAAAIALIGFGWSWNAARLGAMWGVCLVLLVGMIVTGWRVAQLNPNGAQELLNVPPAAGQVDLMITTLKDLSIWQTHQQTDIEVWSMVDLPSLRWALRDFAQARFVSGLTASDSPPVVITLQDDETPMLAQAYRGQDFIWTQNPGWQGLLPEDIAAWLANRQAPLALQRVVLWARVDVFPDGAAGQ